MVPVLEPLINTSKLKSFAAFLISIEKHTDSQFVNNLIEQIELHKGADKSCIDRWLQNAFSFPKKYDDFNCIDTYNFSFYLQILENI